jgi:hypothetical protein
MLTLNVSIYDIMEFIKNKFTAKEQVVPLIAEEQVVPLIAEEQVVPLASEEQVVPLASEKTDVSLAAEKIVTSLAAKKIIVSLAAEKTVTSLAAEGPSVSLAAEEPYVSLDAKESVSTHNLWDFLEHQTKIYLGEQHENLLLQTINANMKWKTGEFINDHIETQLTPKFERSDKITDILKSNYDMAQKIKHVCKKPYDDTHDEVMLKYCKLANSIVPKIDISTSTSTTLSISTSTSSSEEKLSLDPQLTYGDNKMLFNSEKFLIYKEPGEERHHSYLSKYIFLSKR